MCQTYQQGYNLRSRQVAVKKIPQKQSKRPAVPQNQSAIKAPEKGQNKQVSKVVVEAEKAS